MKICLIGDFTDRPDEGYRNIIKNLTREVSSVHEVHTINARPPHRDNFITETRKFKPDIIHYLTAPTLTSLLITRSAKWSAGNGARTVVSCLHPNGLDTFTNPISSKIASRLKPDIMLTQDDELDAILQKRRFQTEHLPNGVDIDKFRPVTPEEKASLREKYDIAKNVTVVLHVGHVVCNRGLNSFNRMMKEYDGIQGVVVGSSYFEPDQAIIKGLREDGCQVWMKHFERIEEFYQLSDIYVFPVQKRGSVSMPLSVMEAMACDLPVITTQYGSLKHWFGEQPSLYYVDDEDGVLDAIGRIQNSPRANNRALLENYSWKDVGLRLMAIYQGLMEGDR